MTKIEFLLSLEKRLLGLPKEDIEKSLEYYSEMIDERMEAGIFEDQAVEEMGSIDKIANEIISNISLSKLVKEKIKIKRRLNVFEIILLALGSPIWISILISLFAIALSIYVVVWSMAIVVYSVAISLGAGGIGGLFLSIIYIIFKNATWAGIFLLGSGFLCMGLAILSIYLSIFVTKLIIKLSKLIFIKTKYLLIKKGDN